MKISIITPTFNSAGTIKDTLQSIATQSYKEVEHIIVDGMSTDNTLNIASTFPHVSKIISEPDLGIFDAMNKGIRSSTGDIVGILNSDDYYAHDKVLEYVAAAFENNSLDAIYGNVYFVKPDNLVKIVRDYSSKNFRLWMFAFGYTPPHPTFFAKKALYDQYGLFDIAYKYAGDYELMMRFLYTHKIKSAFNNNIEAFMRTGGASNKSPMVKYALNKEIIAACKTNGVYTNLFILFGKYLFKIHEYISPLLKQNIQKSPHSYNPLP